MNSTYISYAKKISTFVLNKAITSDVTPTILLSVRRIHCIFSKAESATHEDIFSITTIAFQLLCVSLRSNMDLRKKSHFLIVECQIKTQFSMKSK